MTNHPFVQALRESLAGQQQKLAAYAVYPDADDAESRVSKQLNGRLNLHPELIEFALRGPGGRVLLDYCAQLVRGDPETIREEAARELAELNRRVGALAEALTRADEIEERRGPVKVLPRQRSVA